MIECIEYTRLFDDGVQPHRWAEARLGFALVDNGRCPADVSHVLVLCSLFGRCLNLRQPHAQVPLVLENQPKTRLNLLATSVCWPEADLMIIGPSRSGNSSSTELPVVTEKRPGSSLPCLADSV